MALVVGVDSSTQSCKVEIRDAETARVVASGSAPHPRTTPPVSEQHPKQWWQAFVAAFEQAKAGVDPSQIGAIAVAAQCHGLVLLDGSGAVLRPAKLWNDLTSAPQAEAMVTAAGAPFWADAVGSVPNAAFTISKLAWVAEHEPEILARAAAACLPHDWLTWKLSGRLVTDRSEASGTGYYSARESAYRRDILGEFGRVSAELALPEVLGPDTAVGLIDPATARELGLGAGVLVGPGAGDQHAAGLAMGIGPGDVVFSLGTSGVVMTVSEASVHDPSGLVTGVCDATGRYLPLICTLNATKVTDWFRELLGVDYAEFDALALSVPVTERTLTLAAYLDGERTPSLPKAVGILAGLTTDTSRAQLARAAVDGVVLGLIAGLEAIRRVGVACDGRVIAAGGGAKSAAYRQSIADFLGRGVEVLDAGGATVRGACLQAATILAGVGIDQMRDAWRPTVVSITDPGEAPLDRSRGMYEELVTYRALDRP